jgi:signal transduction histidine kinase
MAHVFTLFKRLHTKDKYEGTGIGLAITKRIIEKHNGTIIAHSVEGQGSEFIIVLPCATGKTMTRPVIIKQFITRVKDTIPFKHKIIW